MARKDENLGAEERVRRSVARTLGNLFFVLLLLALAGGWAWFGFYQLAPGQAAVILRLGRHVDTVGDPGLQWHLPPPLETHEIVNANEVIREEFGARSTAKGAGREESRAEASMQTSDNNIVELGFVVQYKLKDAFAARYSLAEPRATLRDAAQAAVREVVGRMTIDDVLSKQRAQVASASLELLQGVLDDYAAGVSVSSIELQDVHAPDPVRAAFDDVVGAGQDANRLVNEAEGYRNEILPGARAEAVELTESANGYREARVAEASGEAQRFLALQQEHGKAPEVTEKRLYLETMESVLPNAETVIIEPGAAGLLPYLPLVRDAAGGKP
ncbi:MAG TPA: FtsH protease activity modulator HflK [Myxococcota bacterium]|jgi:membrane protease subunit HflK